MAPPLGAGASTPAGIHAVRVNAQRRQLGGVSVPAKSMRSMAPGRVAGDIAHQGQNGTCPTPRSERG